MYTFYYIEEADKNCTYVHNRGARFNPSRVERNDTVKNLKKCHLNCSMKMSLVGYDSPAFRDEKPGNGFQFLMRQLFEPFPVSSV